MSNPEQTEFFFTSAKEDVDRILSLFLSLIFHPEFDEQELKKMREEEIMTAVVQEVDYAPWQLAEEWAGNLVFDWDFRLSLGAIEDIIRLGKQELVEWHRRYYHALNSFINVHGDMSEEKTKNAIENAHLPLKGEKPSIHRMKWKTKKVSIKRGGKTVEMVYGFKIAQYDPALEFLRILGNYPLFILWEESMKRFCSSANSQLKWTSTEGGFFICLAATSRENADEIDRLLIPMIENLEISEYDVELAKKMRTLEILSMKDEGDLTERDFQVELNKAKEVNREHVLSIAEKILNEENAVRVSVGNV